MHLFRTLMLIVGLTALAHPALAQSAKLFDVTITNVTRAQSFTPFLVTTHAPEVSLFVAGEPASAELEILAEDGNTEPLAGVLAGLGKAVGDVQGSAGLLDPGKSVTVRVEATRRASVLSFAAMLIPTNDNFVALDSLPLPRRGAATAMVPAYDAGTEINDQDCANIPGPVCGGEGFSEAPGEGYVYIGNGFHDLGEGTLGPATYDWRNPVAKVTVERVQ